MASAATPDMGGKVRPRVIRTLKKDGSGLRTGPTGEVGTVYHGSGFEVVWVRKQREALDPNWFESPRVDLLVVVQGRLRVEFLEKRQRSQVLGVGDVLVLPARAKCRAYRWPRRSRRATVFLAVYPDGSGRSSSVPRRRGRGKGLRVDSA